MSRKKNEDKIALEAIEAQAVEHYRLAKPLRVNGKDVTDLELDFASLTGTDMMNIEAQMLAMGQPPSFGLSEFSKTYLLHVAARASGINIHDLQKLNYKDSTAITMLAQSFLLNG